VVMAENSHRLDLYEDLQKNNNIQNSRKRKNRTNQN